MGFWIFMLFMDLLIPFTMIFFGKFFLKQAPKEINMAFGYRTSMSMKNQDTWQFAHQFIGKLWYRMGLVMLPVSILVMLFVLGGNEQVVGWTGGILCEIQLVPLAGAILPTELALKKTFDQDGVRR